jgi:hypothetical protein
LAKHPNAKDLEDLLWETASPRERKVMLDLVASNSMWVSKSVCTKIGTVFPQTIRTSKREDRGRVVNGLTLYDNHPAQDAFWAAIGSNGRHFENANVCHVYSERGVQDPQHFTRLANLLVLPKSLASLSDSDVGPVRDILRYRTYKLYGYRGPDRKRPPRPAYYPKVWAQSSELDPQTESRVLTKLRRWKKERPWYRRAGQHPGLSASR